MKKRLGERRNTPERKQGRKEESKRSSLVHFSPLDRPHTRGGSCARPHLRGCGPPGGHRGARRRSPAPVPLRPPGYGRTATTRLLYQSSRFSRMNTHDLPPFAASHPVKLGF